MGSLFFGFIAISFFAVPSAQADIPPRRLDALVQKAKEKNLWTDPQWVNLIHYEKGFFGGVTAQPDGANFFLASDGKKNPEAELLATLVGFYREPTVEERAPPKALSDEEMQEKLKQSQASYGVHAKKTEAEIEAEVAQRKKEITEQVVHYHPICQFPARLRFLKRELGWDGSDLPEITCFELDEFRRRLDAASASLVFSSFFLNNPSSTFGHSFIRVNSGLWSQYGNYRNELLDTGINYAANVTVANPVLYAIFGIAGMFPGTFTAVPYYYKVREYNDFESRDLWSYDLKLTPDELAMLVDHIWEEGATYYDYFYFTENCSYHMFTLLDAAAPRLRLAERLPSYVIPSDTIRVLNQVPDLVSRITYRPSVLSQFRYRLADLNPAEKKELDHLMETKDPASLDSNFSKESQSKILDTYSDQIELADPKELIVDGSPAQILKQKILIKRASLGVKSATLDVPPPERSAPHLGHGIRRVSLGYSHESHVGNSVLLGWKFSMHELLDPGLGYPRNMQVDFGQARIRYRDRPEKFRKNFEIDELNLFKLTALTPMSRYYSSKSVRGEVGWKKTIDPDCLSADHRCFPFVAEFAPGWSVDPSGVEDVTLFAFLGGRFSYTPNYQGINVRFAAGPRVGALVYFSDSLRFLIQGEYQGRVWAEQDWMFMTEAALRYGFVKGWAVDISAKRERDWSEGMTQLHFYY